MAALQKNLISSFNAKQDFFVTFIVRHWGSRDIEKKLETISCTLVEHRSSFLNVLFKFNQLNMLF